MDGAPKSSKNNLWITSKENISCQILNYKELFMDRRPCVAVCQSSDSEGKLDVLYSKCIKLLIKG